MSRNGRYCDLDHPRPARAVVRVQVKSMRVGRPGHPMVREQHLCGKHARQLNELGFETVAN